jgi:hypothetical protein
MAKSLLLFWDANSAAGWCFAHAVQQRSIVLTLGRSVSPSHWRRSASTLSSSATLLPSTSMGLLEVLRRAMWRNFVIDRWKESMFCHSGSSE